MVVVVVWTQRTVQEILDQYAELPNGHFTHKNVKETL